MKARAESFARNLQNRLRSLSESEDSTWNDAASVDSEVYYDIDSSLASPEEEVAEPIFIAVKNRDTLPLLQRSDSEASTYFDTIEDVEELAAFRASASQSSLKLNLLQRRNEDQSTHLTNGSTPITNGHVDSLGSSEMNFNSKFLVEQEIMENENNLNGCMDNCIEYETVPDLQGEVHIFEQKIENGYNEANDLEEEILAVDLNSNVNVDLSKSDMEHFSVNNTPEENSANTESQFCVFCDIEQIKSSLSNALSNALSEESLPTMKKEGIVQDNRDEIRQNDHMDKEENDKTSIIPSKHNEEQDSDLDISERLEESSVNVLQSEDSNSRGEKPEITSNETKLKNDLDNNQPANEKESSELLRPSIEVSEPCSSSSEAQLKTIDEEFDIEEKRKHFRRSSSLRSGKTPPSTPGRKKIVRFADVLGLDLADIKTFLDEVPTIPMSAFDDLHGIDLNPSSNYSENKIIVAIPQLEKILSPLFQQPCIQPNFLDRVRESNVCLENAMVSDTTMFTITGLVRVKNIDFHKSVYIRYTLNDWKSFSDLQARYIQNSYDGFSDKFTFILYAHTLSIGQRLQFAVRFHTAGAQFWDSNGGVNYIFECTSLLPKSTAAPPLPSLPTETASFY